MVKMAGAIWRVSQACKSDFAFDQGLKPAPVIRGVDQAASTREVFVIGREVVSTHYHGVSFCNDAEVMPDRYSAPGCRPPPVDVRPSPIARHVIHSSAK